MERTALRTLSGAGRGSLGAAGIGLLATLAGIAQLALISAIVNDAFLGHDDLGRLAVPMALLPLALIARAALLWLRDVTAQAAASRVKATVRRRLVAHLFALGPGYVSGQQVGELVATATEGVERLEPYVARYEPQVALSVLAPLLIAGVVWTQDPLSAAILLLTAPVIPLLMVLVGSYAGGQIARQWVALSRMHAFLLETIQGLPTLVLFGRAAAQREHVERVSLSFRDRTVRVLRYAFLSALVLEFMTSGAIALIAVELGTRLISGSVSFGLALLVLLLAPEFYRPLRDLGVHRHAAMEGSAAAERIAAILAAPAQVRPGCAGAAVPVAGMPPTDVGDAAARDRHATTSPMLPLALTRDGAAQDNRHLPGACSGSPDGGPEHAPGDLHVAPQPFGGRDFRYRFGESAPSRSISLTLSDVRYVYPGSAEPALDGLHLTLPAGTRTAVVGPSGAGKSTLVALLLRFLEPGPGQIAANGLDVTALTPEAWRALVALVPQRPHLFHGTIRENILLGRPDACDAALYRAAEAAGVAAFVGRLPLGYDTPVGERGAALSGGEAQRIAIARAFLKDAPLLVLDEPTSSLDAASEALIREAIDRLTRDRTTLVVAHRLNTVYTADQIAVLESGRLVEIGDHRDLVSRDGLYSRLVGERAMVAL